jgi:hypothetical protein
VEYQLDVRSTIGYDVHDVVTAGKRDWPRCRYAMLLCAVILARAITVNGDCSVLFTGSYVDLTTYTSIAWSIYISSKEHIT